MIIFKRSKRKKSSVQFLKPLIILHFYGGVAQLGERLNGIQEVNGSIPSVSTKKSLIHKLVSFLSTVFLFVISFII